MKKQFIETITNVLDENENLIKTTKIKTYVITPDERKVFLNLKTNEFIRDTIGIGTEDSIDNYEEIDDPDAKFFGDN